MGVDRVVRCWRNLVLALMLACSGSAFASFPATASGGVEYHVQIGATDAWISGASAACHAVAAAYTKIKADQGYNVPHTGVAVVDGTDARCTITNSYDSWSSWLEKRTTPTTYSCPAHSLVSGSSCTCDSGYAQEGGQCTNNTQQKKCSDAKGGSDWFSGFSSLPNVGSDFCPSDGSAASCGTTVSGGYCTVKAGVKSCAYEVKYTGATCTPPTSSTESPRQDPCKGSSGTVNGKTVCVPVGSDPSATTETKTSSTDSKTTTATDGTSTTTTTSTDKTTSCTGGQCTTTTTTTTSGGSGGTTTDKTEKTEPKEDYCTTNPKAAVCQNSTFGGSCSAAFTCDGDAIQCAMAKDQLQRNCQALDEDKDSGSVTNKALSGEDKLNTNEMKADAKGAPVQVGSFNTSGRGWGRSCPVDPVIAIPWAKGNSNSFTIPFSRLCGVLALLANGAVAVTLLGALAWVVGGSKAAA